MDTQNESRSIQGDAQSTRPVRKNFKNLIVFGSNGARVDEALVAQKITETVPKLRRRQLRAEGWTQVQVFDRERYNEAFAKYRESNKKSSTDQRASMIKEAFEATDQGRNARVERALSLLLPLYAGAHDRKVVDALRKIVRVVSMTAPGYIEKTKNIKAKGKSTAAEAAIQH